jgi:hypothetical protein
VRCLSRKQIINGMHRLGEGALLDDCFHVLPAVGVMALWEHGDEEPSRTPGSHSSQYVSLYGLKPFGDGAHACAAELAEQ